MQYFERSYEKDSKLRKDSQDEVIGAKTTHIEVLAFEEEDNDIPDHSGYYYHAYFIQYEYADGTKEVAAQVRSPFSKMNYADQSGWYLSHHHGSLKKMARLVQKLEGYKPLSDAHRKIIENNIDYLEAVV